MIAQIWGLTNIQIWSKFKLYKVTQNYESSAEATSLGCLVGNNILLQLLYWSLRFIMQLSYKQYSGTCITINPL